jgi:hypothetical protein
MAAIQLHFFGIKKLVFKIGGLKLHFFENRGSKLHLSLIYITILVIKMKRTEKFGSNLIHSKVCMKKQLQFFIFLNSTYNMIWQKYEF